MLGGGRPPQAHGAPGPAAPAPWRGLWARSVPGHAEGEARAALGEVGLWLVEPRLHGDGALLPMQAALHGVGDVDLKVALLTGRTEKKKTR